ncbi:hypothetical protein ACXZ65_22700 [Streptomyces aculeolatus]
MTSLEGAIALTADPLGSAEVSQLFTDEPVFTVPDLVSRYAYKKDPGSSDTHHQYDSIRV